MTSNGDPSSTYNFNLLSGSITTIATTSDGIPIVQPSGSQTLLAGQMLPPTSPNVPSSSKAAGGKAKSPSKVKTKESLEKNSEEYIRRRQRNNVAVKKSREKTRERTVYTLQKVEQLKVENEELETKISILTKELSVLKDLFMDHAKGFCAGGNVDVMNPDQLEKLLGCKVIKSNVNPSTSAAEGSSSTTESPMQPLINAAETMLRPYQAQTVDATVLNGEEVSGSSTDLMENDS